jgi:catechol 2,3-dioxygenase-like lactoylglutathione lyase family enzyme
MKATLLAIAFVLGGGTVAWGQLIAAKDGPIVYGHHHVNVTSVDAHKKFWADALGGVPIKVGTAPNEIVKFPNVLVFLAARTPSGGTKGTTVNHVGFETPNLRAAVDKLKAAGYPMVTRAELPDSYAVKDDLGQRPGGNLIAFVMGPDETKVELIENKAITYPIVMHHVHFAAPDVAAMKAWYVKTFAARPGTRAGFEAADLPGVNLTYSPAPDPVVGTRGRALDHIGFEVKNLEAFCKQLEASGIKLDRPYSKVPTLGIAIAFFTDPWGTYVELTEGLSAVP